MLSIDGVHIEKDLGLHLLESSNEPILPSTRDNVVSIPGKHGAYAFKAYMSEKTFFQEVLIPTQATLFDVQNIIRKITPLILDQYGNPKEVELKWDYDPDKYYRGVFSGYVSIDRIHRAGKFYLPFTAYDPYAYSVVYADEVTWGSEVLTFESSYELGHTGTDGITKIIAPTTLNAFLDGYAVKPIFEISGSADNLTVTNGEQSFSLPSFNGDWVIDCERYTVTKNGTNVFSEVSLREFWLNKGSNFIVIGGFNLDIKIRMKFRDRYL
ncbi:phage tail domain-containing protein [Ornithinibacillus xuwenensis]|uniref:Phage tail domain-containing protein n=1 Tax=Ornithinibacillus xuwenensis TaxID=3144668 RepID=A0ABU9XC47_9BACI